MGVDASIDRACCAWRVATTDLGIGMKIQVSKYVDRCVLYMEGNRQRNQIVAPALPYVCVCQLPPHHPCPRDATLCHQLQPRHHQEHQHRQHQHQAPTPDDGIADTRLFISTPTIAFTFSRFISTTTATYAHLQLSPIGNASAVQLSLLNRPFSNTQSTSTT
ncbi:predicted protein [Plenodomus lingam JN3]|uniref:Predicted protein n=1 Tax=Leptosphaeria maculans (strain JN3 / isolate v23.1.3 / race Av1-4-5-6-7-8) TaxID=985895 RepID=E5A4Q4_LEPMJ|nr:predicted protein [Plenodomus lingam JN3]CBX98602.1 predicted protein [Plenodomus lingam JN3]